MSVVIDLKTKLHVKGFFKDKEIEQIKLRVPVVGDLIGIGIEKGASVETMIKLVSRLSGLTEEQIKQIEASDYLEIAQRVTNMLEPRKK